MIELKQWSGSFIEDGHRYFRKDGKELLGITGILQRRLFKDEYKDIPEWILDNAAKRGSMIHSRVQLYDETGLGDDMPEVRYYGILKNELRLEHIASEYLVSDDENYATAIDKVYHLEGAPDNEVIIGDVKTTSKFNREYVAWQLSIGAEFLERMNPGIKVAGFYGIWLREDKYKGSIHKFIPIERKPSEIVRELLSCDIEDREFHCNLLPTFITDNIDRLVFLNEQIKQLTQEKEEITQSILESMRERDDKSIDTGLILFTRKEGGERKTFDSARFREEHSDLYEKYIKTSTTKENIQLTFRN